jgi:hypothetical protein
MLMEVEKPYSGMRRVRLSKMPKNTTLALIIMGSRPTPETGSKRPGGVVGTRHERRAHQRRWATALEQAGQAQELYQQGGDTRSAARAQTIAGEACE